MHFTQIDRQHDAGPQDPSFQDLCAALADQAPVLSQWLMESEAVFVLLLALDGIIRLRNRASSRVFTADPATQFGLTLWDFLAHSDAETLRRQFSDPLVHQQRFLRLNLFAGQQGALTLEVGLLRVGDSMLLIGAKEQWHDATLQAELLRLTNDMSMMMRDAAQKNRLLREANETIERLARTDALTGLANRRSLDDAFQHEMARSRRSRQHLTLVLADLDHFKSINDDYGHLAGDEVLAAAAAVFAGPRRLYDIAARFGGEEFALLLPETSIRDASAIAERIRKKVEQISIPACPRRVTMSLGVAGWTEGETQDQLVARADAALYRAKYSGRNRVEIASSP